MRRAKKVWDVKQKLKRAKWITDWIDENWTNWYHLSPSDQKLYNSMEDLRTGLQEAQRTPAGERCAGAGSGTAHM